MLFCPPKLIRLFVTSEQEDKSGNLNAGFVADEGIVHSNYTDFYLQSQGGLKGSE